MDSKKTRSSVPLMLSTVTKEGSEDAQAGPRGVEPEEGGKVGTYGTVKKPNE